MFPLHRLKPSSKPSTPTPPSTPPLLTLPPEILLQIFSPLPNSTLYSLRLTCKHLSYLPSVPVYTRTFTPTPKLLLTAVRTSNTSLTRYILSHNAPIPTTIESFTSHPLYIAASSTNLDIVHLLLSSGYTDSTPSIHSSGMAPLSRAITNTRTEIVSTLLSHPSTNIHRPVGTSVSQYAYLPIHYAALSCNVDILRLVIEAGADVNSRTADAVGCTPIQAVVNNGEFPEWPVKFLVAAGAELGIRDLEGRTALHWACMPWRHLQGSIAEQKRWEGSMSAGCKRVIRMLVELGCDVNAVDEEGRTPLHLAAAGREARVLKGLLDVGADVNVVDKNGETALHMAVMRKEEEVVRGLCKLLVEAGVDVNMVDKKGETALHMTVMRKEKEEVVRGFCKLLIEAGVDRGLKNRRGRTALDIAKKRERWRNSGAGAKLFKVLKVPEKGFVTRLFERGEKK